MIVSRQKCGKSSPPGMTSYTLPRHRSFPRIPPMKVPGAQAVFRLGGLVAWLLVVTETLAGAPALPPGTPAWVRPANTVIVLLAMLAFAIAFWRNSRSVAAAPAPGRVALLVLQIAIGMVISTDLLFLAAAEVPFVLPRRPAVGWMAAQGAATVVLALLIRNTSGFEFTPGLEHLPRSLALTITISGALGWQLFAFCVGFVAANETRSAAELSRLNAELRSAQGLLAESSRLAERLQIARELHDTVGHHLTVLSVNLELARKLTDGRATSALADAQAVTRLLLADVREVVTSLREERGVDLRRALEGLAAAAPEPLVHLDFPATVEVDDPVQAHALFRCAQEAITNAVRHARARNLWIEVAPAAEGGLRLTARDDGCGAAAWTPGNGLRGMRERLERVGGTLEVIAAPGAGFSLLAVVPAAGAAGDPTA